VKQQRPFEKGFYRTGGLYKAGLVYYTHYRRILPTGQHLNLVCFAPVRQSQKVNRRNHKI